MKRLFPSFISLLFMFVLCCTTQSIIADTNIDKQQLWIESLLNEEGESLRSNDYLFYCTGHHGIIWSLITSDSSRIHLFNGTTRNHLEYTDQISLDTLSFIKENFKTITWGFDSLANDAQFLIPLKNEAYNPLYNELYVIKNNKIVFRLNNADSYSGRDSINFNKNLENLVFLMYWLASPSIRTYLPTPCDTLSAKSMSSDINNRLRRATSRQTEGEATWDIPLKLFPDIYY